MTPEPNARMIEVETYGTRTAPAKHLYRLAAKERRETPMKYYAKYLRYALSVLDIVTLGISWR